MKYLINQHRQGKLNKLHLIIVSIVIYVFCYCYSVLPNINQQSDLRLENSNHEDIIQWPQEGSTTTGGWIETAWHLLDPYNQFCPLDTTKNKKTQVGCVALAMAQVVNYHNHLPNLHFDEDDIYKTLKNEDDMNTTLQGITIGEDISELELISFDSLNTYIDMIRDKYEKGVELDSTEMAALGFACGVTIKMNYRTNGSYPKYGGWIDSVASSLNEKMGYYSAAKEFFITPDTEKLDSLLIENIVNGLPVIIILPDHAIIADGYNTNGFFHFNFGYGNKKPTPITDMWWTIDELVNRKGEITACIFNINPIHPDWSPQIATNYDKVYFLNSDINNSTEKTIKISNPGEHSIYIDHIIPSKNFDHGLREVAFPIVLDPGQELSVNIKFTPDISEAIAGKLQVFASCATVKKYLEIDLYGECIEGYAIRDGNVFGSWKKDISPYYVMGNISIPAGETLIIEPGTEIIFKDSYKLSIENKAKLVAIGTENDSIYFTASNINQGWQGLVFENSGMDDTLAYCVISHGNQTSSSNRGGVISLISSSPFISHSRITNSSSSGNGGCIYLNNSSPTITNTLFKCNRSTFGGALYLTNHSSPNLSNVVFSKNEATFSGGAIYCNNSDMSLSNVSIRYNSAVYSGGGISISGNSYLNFDSDSRCNIYSNDAPLGKDLYNNCSNSISVIVDTFTVLIPTNSFAYSEDTFAFDILHERSDISVGIDLFKKNIPIEFFLSQNYPNPFNASTKIKFDLPYSTHVKIEIYNIIGQKIVTLLNDYKTSGRYEVEFDAQNLSSGTYLYRIQTGEFQEVRKMTLIR